ncbi:MAG: hypothetical protein GX987_07290 [Tissierellia bacterium]|nr:hypothetical protein [Tissierellia bacterium]
MRKVIGFLLIFVITMSLGIPVFAAMEEKLGNHWSKNMINKDFLLYYFPYLAKEDFKRFNPNEPAYEDEFLLSFSSLLRDNGYSNGLIGWKRELTRAEMSKILGKKLIEEGLIKPSNKKLPFTDINNLPQEEQKIIAALYQTGIIKGESNTIYNPKRNVTQAEAIIVLQRLKPLLNKVINIPFKLSGVVEAYSGKEGVNSKSEGEKVLVTITKEFPTPGYSMKVEKVERNKEEYKIYLDITPPSKESDQLQVIAYKTITIVIDRKDLGNPPYKFVLEGF